MRVTPCGVCHDLEGYVAIQMGKDLICEACVRAFPWFLLTVEPRVFDTIWGEELLPSLQPLDIFQSIFRQFPGGDGQVHSDLAVAYQQMGLVGEALSERRLALALATPEMLDGVRDQLAMLLAIAQERSTLGMLLRELGFARASAAPGVVDALIVAAALDSGGQEQGILGPHHVARTVTV